MSSLPALDAWIAIKTVLLQQLGRREWDLWIRHARLMKASPASGRYAAGMLVAMPRNGKAIFGAMRFYLGGTSERPRAGKLKAIAQRLGYDLCLCVAPDAEVGKLFHEAVAELDDDDPRKRYFLDEADRAAQEERYLEDPPSELWR